MKEALEYFRANTNEISYCPISEIFLKVPCGKKEAQTYHYYRVDVKQKLGQGTFGTVFKCFRFDFDKDDPTKFQENPMPFAVKVISDRECYNPREAKFLQNYYFSENPIDNGKHIFIVQEFFPGEDLFIHEELSPHFKNLTFTQTLELLYQIALLVNLFHHSTPRTGPAISHADLKGTNIRVNRTKEGGISVFLFDFGLTDTLSHDFALLTKLDIKGTRLYAPIESQKGVRGAKSDIYSMAGIFLKCLHADAFSEKLRVSIKCQVPLVPFNFNGLLEPYKADIANCPAPLKNYIEFFINKMQSLSYKLRPDSDEVLRFITLLKNFYHCYLKNPHDETLIFYSTKMAILASGLWKIDDREQTTQEDPLFTPKINYEYFQFSLQHCAKILTAYQNKTLNFDSIVKITHPDSNLNNSSILTNQLAELKGIIFEPYVEDALTLLIRVDQRAAIVTFQHIRNFTPPELDKFRKLTHLLFTYAKVDASTIIDLTYTLDAVQVFQKCLHVYQQKLISSLFATGDKNTFFTRFQRKDTRKEELPIIEKLLAHICSLDQNVNLFGESEINLLLDSPLGALITNFQSLTGFSIQSAKANKI